MNTENKLPRKLKKQLKAAVLNGKDPAWKSSEVKIKSVSRFGYEKTKLMMSKGVERVGTLFITSYSLSPR